MASPDDTPRQEKGPGSARRHATVLFADLSGFTAMCKELDPEDVHETMNSCFTLLEEIVVRHGGWVDKYIGDCVMALFGAPKALEDAPRRAINAAIEMRERLPRLLENRALPASLEMHFGINTGLVLAGDVGGTTRRDFTVMGDTVNVASRLKDVATLRQILVGPQTWAETKHVFTFREHVCDLKGISSSYLAHEVLSDRPQLHRTATDRPARTLFSEMVGRDHELAVLRERIARVVDGQGGIVSIVAEAGLGKSRLIAEAMRLPQMAKTQPLMARAISMGGSLAFHPFIDLLRQWAGIAEEDPESTVQEKLAAALRTVLGERTAELYPFVATLMGVRLDGPDAERLAGIDAEGLEKLITRSLRELLIAGAARRPLVLVFEDAHWADLSSVQLLLTLLPLARAHPILFVIACRPDHEQTTRRLLTALRERLALLHTEIPLRRLDDHECVRLLRNLIRHDDRPHTTRKVILSRADGNPFFIEEVVRSLIDEGVIVRADDGLHVTERIDRSEVPGTIREVVMARVDRLPTDPRLVLQLGSVIGRTFPARLLAQVAGEVPALDFALAQLVHRDLLEETRLGEEASYAFKHALAQETIYESILRRTRRDVHAKVARAIERLFSERLSDYFGMLAYHYGRAEDLERAGDYLQKAGDEAVRAAASSEALAYFIEAARVFDLLYGERGDAQSRAQLQKKIGLAHLNKGDLPAALEHFDRALAHLGEREPATSIQTVRRLAADLGAILFHVYLRGGRPRQRPPDARTREAIEIRFHKGKAQSTSAPQGYFLGMLRGIRALGQVDPQTVEQACGIYAASAALFAYSGISFDVSARLLPLSRRLAHNLRDELGYRTMAFLHHYLRGDWSDQHTIPDELLDEGLRYGVFWEINTYLGLDCERRICQGRFAEARALIARIARIGDEYGYDFVRGNEYFMTAYLHLEERDLAAAREALERYYADRSEEALHLLALGTRCEIETLAGDFAAARAASDDAEAIARRLGQQVAPYHVAPHRLSRWLLALSEPGSAVDGRDPRALARRARTALRVAGKIARERPEAMRLMARQQWERGLRRSALRWWTRALGVAEQLDARPETIRICCEAAERLRAVDGALVAGLDAAALEARAARVRTELAALGGTGDPAAESRHFA
jgi:class 3 adenylate cyclase/tetratricopeptide (TPR) repeat protein